MIPALIAGGAAAGSLLGSVYDTLSRNKATQRAQEAAGKAADATAEGYKSAALERTNIDNLLDQYYAKMGKVYGDIDSIGNEYSSLLLGDGTVFNPTDFDYTKTVEDFYDPAWQVNNQAQMRALENSAANSGKLFSSGLQQNMAGTTAANATNAYKEAREAYYTDKNLAQDQWYKANQLAKDRASLNLNRAGLLGDYTNGFNDWLSNYTNAKQSNASAGISDYMNALNNYTNLMSQSDGTSSNAFPSYQSTNGSMPALF